jgi:soluble calcium-activated nucleotidase 1
MAIPWTIEADGDGITNKSKSLYFSFFKNCLAFKTEWLAVKGEELYVGGYGKEYTDARGRWLNDNPLWIKVIFLGKTLSASFTVLLR